MSYLLDRNQINDLIFSVCLFLFSLGLFNYEKYFIIIFLFLFLFFHFQNNCLIVKKHSQTIPLFIWGMLYCIMCILGGEDFFTSILYYGVAPALMCSLADDKIKNTLGERNYNKYAFIISFGFFLHAFLSISNSASTNLFQHNAEYVRDIWSGRMISRTIMGMYMVPIVCYSIPRIFDWEYSNRFIEKLFYLFFIVSSLLLSIYVGNRALILITIILLCICIGISLVISEKKMKLIVAIVLLLICVSMGYTFNCFGIQEFVHNSFLMNRSKNLASDSRFSIYTAVLNNFLDYIGGWISSGGKIAGTGMRWAHNIWIDILVYAGIIPFFVFIVYTLRVLRDSNRALKCKQLKKTTRLFGVSSVIGVLLNWAVEPVLQSNPYFVSACCFIFGMNMNIYKERGKK